MADHEGRSSLELPACSEFIRADAWGLPTDTHATCADSAFALGAAPRALAEAPPVPTLDEMLPRRARAARSFPTQAAADAGSPPRNFPSSADALTGYEADDFAGRLHEVLTPSPQRLAGRVLICRAPPAHGTPTPPAAHARHEPSVPAYAPLDQVLAPRQAASVLRPPPALSLPPPPPDGAGALFGGGGAHGGEAQRGHKHTALDAFGGLGLGEVLRPPPIPVPDAAASALAMPARPRASERVLSADDFERLPARGGEAPLRLGAAEGEEAAAAARQDAPARGRRPVASLDEWGGALDEVLVPVTTRVPNERTAAAAAAAAAAARAAPFAEYPGYEAAGASEPRRSRDRPTARDFGGSLDEVLPPRESRPARRVPPPAQAQAPPESAQAPPARARAADGGSADGAGWGGLSLEAALGSRRRARDAPARSNTPSSARAEQRSRTRASGDGTSAPPLRRASAPTAGTVGGVRLGGAGQGARHPPPASRAVLRRVRYRRPAAPRGGCCGETSSRAECTVCLEEFADREAVLRLPCAHLFHGRCIRTWLQHDRRCPNCRFDLVEMRPAGADGS